ncbi:MAG TPA: T9SS type A sorting domain-containing protein [Bacteroidia bacterium]|jgi:hypothetical protein|nr:T9SS type A sorting domain-containing protein [Bacteroidia bacterium]
MKKSLLIVASLLIGAYTSNAQILNPDFATWSDTPLIGSSSVKDPNSGLGTTGWWSFNLLNYSLLGSSPVSVTPDSTTTYSGAKYSAKITTVVLTSTSYSSVKAYGIPDTMGLIMTGNISQSGFGAKVVKGEPWNNRLTSFNFYYQYTPNGVDTASCSVVVSSTTGGVRTTIGAGELKITAAASSWTLGTVNMTYVNGNIPDTILVMFSSSSLLSKPKPGSVFLIDGVSTVDGVNEVSATPASVSIYPNPATNAVHFTITGNDIANYINVFDMTGKKITTLDAHNNIAILNSSELASGLYFYQLYNKAGNLMKTGKFSISK